MNKMAYFVEKKSLNTIKMIGHTLFVGGKKTG
jgi:hypothetical protein